MPKQTLHEAVKAAGDNAPEIRAVIQHYRGRENRAKRKAAEYLIRNMPGHVSIDGDWRSYRDSLSAVFLAGLPQDEMVKKANEIITGYNPVVSQDIRTLKADYLINNIEKAFDLWESSPFLQHLDFNEFCEVVLPYKCYEGQPADNWRDYAAEYGREVLSKVAQIDEWRNCARAAAENVNNVFDLKMDKPLTPQRGLREDNLFDLAGIKSLPYLTCLGMSRMGVILGRANGIPVSFEYLPNWAFRNMGHSWNVVDAENGRQYDYVPFESDPKDPHHVDKKRAKAYRYSYAPDPLLYEAKKRGVKLAKPLTNIFVKDVTHRYNLVSDISVPVLHNKGRYAYLAVFDNRNWVPVQLGKIVFGRARFTNVGRDVLYIVLSGRNEDNLHPISSPFILDLNGHMRVIDASDSSANQDITMSRKYPAFSHLWPIRDSLSFCVLEGSKSRDFQDAAEIARWDDDSLFSVEHQVVDTTKYLYWRLRGTTERVAYISEIYFYKDNLRYVPIDASGHPDAVAMMDELWFTHMGVTESQFAVYCFGFPISFDRVALMRRGDGNCVKPGETYRLSYWLDGKWEKHSEQVANDIRITFRDVPAGHLYRIECLSSGVQHRTFLYENGRCIWY